jgi:hypothetical protein
MGNVGIGTTNPINQLHLHKPADAQEIMIRFTDNSTGTGITDGVCIYKTDLHDLFLNVYENARIYFFTNNIVRMNIQVNGNTCIGSNTPNSIFQVGNAGRLRIANDSNDFSLIGTLDTDNNTSNTKIFLNGIGNTSASAPGFIQYFATGTGSHNFYSGSSLRMELKHTGELLVANDIVAFNTFSDINLKTNIKPLNINCIDLINKINPVEFTWKNIDDIIINKRNKKDYGFIAQEIELLIPSLIYDIKYKSKYKLIKYDKFAPYFVKAIQELHKIIQQQKTEIEELKTEISNIKSILSRNNLS